MDEFLAKNLVFPVLMWDVDYVSPPIKSYKKLIVSSKAGLEIQKERSKRGAAKIIDSSGTLFSIFDEVHIGPFSKTRYWLFGHFFVEPQLKIERKFDLEEFKQCVRKAVMCRARYDKECDVVQQTDKKLPSAKTFREAIESVPEVF